MNQFCALVKYYESLSSPDELILFADIVIPLLHYLYMIRPPILTWDDLDDQLWMGMYKYDERSCEILEDMKQKMIQCCNKDHICSCIFDAQKELLNLAPLELDRWSSVIQWACLYGKYKNYSAPFIALSIQNLIHHHMLHLVDKKIKNVLQYLEYQNFSAS